MANPQHRRWAHDQEEQEEFLADPILVRLREVLRADIQNQRHRVLECLRTADLPRVRWEAGLLEGMASVLSEIEDDDAA